MDNEELEMILLEAEERMQKTQENLRAELQQIRTGRAHPGLLESLTVDYYGVATPLNKLANVSAPEPRMLVVTPFDPTTVQAIEEAIRNGDLGFNPNTADGKIIRVPVPDLSEERRREMAKHTRKFGEDAKIAVRNIRRDANDSYKKADGVGEDEVKGWLAQVQTLTDQFVTKVDDAISAKEKELMEV